MFTRSLGAAAALLVLLATVVAGAQLQQVPLPLDRYAPPFAGDTFFAVASPRTVGDPGFHGALIFDYANDPLVLRDLDAEENEVGPIVGHQLFLHLNATAVLWQRLALNVNAPIALFQAGDDPSIGSVGFISPSGAQFGDLRIGLRGRLWSEPKGVVELALAGNLWLPTGSSEVGSFVSSGTVRGLPQFIVGGRYDRMRYGLNVGVDIRQTQQFADVTQGTSFTWGLAGGVDAGPSDMPKAVLISAELLGNVVGKATANNNTNLELLFGGQWRLGEVWPDAKGLTVGLAVGPGLAGGAGTPDVRTLARIGYGRDLATPSDRDGDGILDRVDACPDVPGIANEDPSKHGCPPPSDRDGDGIFDKVDACPDVPGIASADPTKHGCPPPSDRDGDKIFDNVDACPDVPGVPSADPKKHGCPPPPKPVGDRDKDNINDPVDACPDTPGIPHVDPKKHGCPRVHVTRDEIVINERIEFDFNRATIRSESDSLLDQVAKVLKDNPDILRVEIQGHTDNVGSEAFNQALSERRARAVRAALMKRGIALKRLSTKGYGFKVPRKDADTAEARQRNRRVEFHILERATPAPAAAPGAH